VKNNNYSKGDGKIIEETIVKHHHTFDEMKKQSEQMEEYWRARDLQVALEYASWDKFKRIIKKAITACDNSNQLAENHFSQVGKLVDIGSGSFRKLSDYKLSRYACYLIVQNADSRKSVVAKGQTYFAIQTRRQELADDTVFQQLQKDEKRLLLRNEMRAHNKQLVKVAQQAGVNSNLDFAVFQNHGYKKAMIGWIQKERGGNIKYEI